MTYSELEAAVIERVADTETASVSVETTRFGRFRGFGPRQQREWRIYWARANDLPMDFTGPTAESVFAQFLAVARPDELPNQAALVDVK